MPHSQTPPPKSVSLEDLAQSLFEMRDALLRVALLLRDQEFDFNRTQWEHAQVQVQELMRRLNPP